MALALTYGAAATKCMTQHWATADTICKIQHLQTPLSKTKEKLASVRPQLCTAYDDSLELNKSNTAGQPPGAFTNANSGDQYTEQPMIGEQA
jgi:hypothetical protein